MVEIIDIRVKTVFPLGLFVSEVVGAASIYGVDNLNVLRDSLSYGLSHKYEERVISVYEKHGGSYSVVDSCMGILRGLSFIDDKMARDILKLAYIRIYSVYTISSLHVYDKYVSDFTGSNEVGNFSDADELLSYIDE